MSREPSSAANRLRASGFDPIVEPEPPKLEPAKPRKPPRVRVEMPKPKPKPEPRFPKGRPTRKTVYEPLSEQERTWLRGYRAPRRVSEMTAEQMNDYRLYPGGDS